MGKQMEGDNKQRRQRAKEARDAGTTAGEAGVSLGGSKQDYHLGDEADHDEKMRGPGRGKQEPERSANPMRPGSGEDGWGEEEGQ